jgi:hypothetical protein
MIVPIEDVKRLTQSDPNVILAFRTMIDKKVSDDEFLELANKKRTVTPARPVR